MIHEAYLWNNIMFDTLNTREIKASIEKSIP